MNTIIRPMLGIFNLGGGEIILILFLLLSFAAVLVVGGLIVFLLTRPKQKPESTATTATPAEPPIHPPQGASGTEVIPRKCPKCGADLKTGAPEGLCPACLLQHGLATEGGAPPGTPPFTPPSLAELAKLFPQLEILEVIGQGGMGAVYKARQPALERFVALKILMPRPGGDLDFSGRFTREARALARLSHPNIVAVYDFGQVQRLTTSQSATGQAAVPETLNYFLMEYVDGPNLRQVEQAGKLTPREALQIIPQICIALQFAHDEGIVHRDIKPENVLLDKKGRVKIADFGLAKILGQEADFRLTGARDVMGTPHYMAPEQVETPQEVDHRADIYSLGVVFYEMLTGELPLGKFDPPSHKVQIDVRLDDVVMRSLSKSPERRYQHVSEVGTRVETIAQTTSAAGGAKGVASDAIPEIKDYQLNIGGCLGRGWNLVKQNFWPLVGVNALVTVLLALLGSLSIKLSPHDSHFGVGLSFLLAGPLLGGLYLYFLKRIRGENATIEVAFSGFSTRFLHLFLGHLVAGLLIGLGFICLILPGIYLAVAWMFTLVLIIDKGLDFWPAMELSRKIITKHWWKFLWFAILTFLLKMAGVLFCIIGVFITAPIMLAAFLYAYEDIFGVQAQAQAPAKTPARTGSGGLGWKIALGCLGAVFAAFLILVALVGLFRKHERVRIQPTRSAAQRQMQRQMPLERQWNRSPFSNSSESAISLTAASTGLSPSCIAAPPGLVGWWKAETNAFDSAGTNNGTLQNVTYTAGMVGKAFSFDPESYPTGTYTGVKIPDNPAYVLTNAFSIEAWIRPRGDGYVIFWRGDGRPGLDPYYLSMEANTHLRFGITDSDGNAPYVEVPLVYNQWWHLVGTFDANAQALKLYTNGVLAGQTNTTVIPIGNLIADESPGIGIGNVNDGGNNFPFFGDIDEASLYSRALTPTEIAALYLANSAGKCPDLETDSLAHNDAYPVRNSALASKSLLAKQPPVVVETFPASGARDIPPGEMEIHVRFSKEMAPYSGTGTGDWENTAPEFIGPAHYLPDGRTYVMKVRLEPGKTYECWLNSEQIKSFTDKEGVPAVPYLLIFQTKDSN